LSTPEFWLSVIIGPIIATLAAEYLKSKSSDQWARGVAYATLFIAFICGSAIIVVDGNSIQNSLIMASICGLIYVIASETKTSIVTFMVVAINLPMMALLALGIYRAGAEKISSVMIGFAYIYLGVSLLIGILAIGWAAVSRGDRVKPES
jgi:hypothetical protein